MLEKCVTSLLFVHSFSFLVAWRVGCEWYDSCLGYSTVLTLVWIEDCCG
ncbi:hypothetical protein Ptr902_01218 [Pyrenophora tritici-repentis]|nr:hypothetical protein PtrV1_01681 [Pyrenophora tritici-repentis]KAI0578991.1 hypothetical protein Alg130_07688 [Pyrenophora tritici-repentis]KAI0581348.1 hypothetical protein Alg215_04755 [Pyrenophora tritici-repentis]KAI0609668.1 hypothetical protein TUN205_06081 [Pyrenophora tritici-repentis]KAI0622352.1 hypothetical protein TUN199_05653 [Pyrenophora tritici-repentis]